MVINVLVLVKPVKELKGKIKISGSKNSCLPIMAISLLTNKKITLNNVPMISDIYDMIKILENIGVKINVYPDKNKITLKRKKIKSELLIDEITKIRASYYIIPGMIAKHNKIKIKYPGGCNFMERPIDYHIDALKKAGAKVFEQEKNMIITKDKLRKNIYSFEKPSVGATINAIMLSRMSKGKSKIINQPIEPEINDFINCLKLMGANIVTNNNEIIVIFT